ncbi:unnamed protein product, partial [Porites lobata]
MEVEKLLQIGEKFGLEGEKLLEFVREQQKLEEERRREKEEKEEKRRKLEEERRREEEEKEEKRRQLEEEKEEKRRNDTERAEVREDRAKAPKLPSFVDGKDDLDAYLQRFERFATTAKWEKTGWASKLSALLSGRALEVYSRISEEAAQDYDRVKLALMKRYDLTEDGYRCKFRASKPEVDDSPEQFIVRLDRYLLRWLELSNTERSFEGLKDLIVKEQFIDSCPKELAIHLRERAPETLAQIAKIANQYLEAHGKHLFSSASKKPQVQPKVEETKTAQSDTTALQCYKC